jgi:addiction module RelE/StbE family toxin
MTPKSFKVLIYPQAERDLQDIRIYLERVLKTSPFPLLENLQGHILPLSENPFIHPLVNDPHLREKGYRHIPVDNFLIFYVVVGDVVQVRRVLYRRRDYLRVL